MRDIDCGFKILAPEPSRSFALEAPGALIHTEILALARRRGDDAGSRRPALPPQGGTQSGGSLRVVLRDWPRRCVSVAVALRSHRPPWPPRPTVASRCAQGMTRPEPQPTSHEARRHSSSAGLVAGAPAADGPGASRLRRVAALAASIPTVIEIVRVIHRPGLLRPAAVTVVIAPRADRVDRPQRLRCGPWPMNRRKG